MRGSYPKRIGWRGKSGRAGAITPIGMVTGNPRGRKKR